MFNPLDSDLRVVKWILRYVFDTLDHDIHLVRTGQSHIIGFSESNWASNIDDRRSTSGICIYFGGNLISWASINATCCSYI